MRNNRGIVLSTYIYVLLMFFLFLLVAMLAVLNNTKLLSTRMKEGVSGLTKIEVSDFNIILLGDAEISIFKGYDYVEPGYLAQSITGKSITAEINTNLNTGESGTYTCTYTVLLGGKTKTVTRTITVVDTIYNYDYTGNVQTFTAPAEGYYQLETWGAQGGYASSTTYNGGYGGYSTGVVHLEKNQTVYVYVGGKGIDGTTKTATSFAGGYNGGGNAYGNTDKYVGSGGGSTHIATTSGLLPALATNQSSILIVSAGGGGATMQTTTSYSIGGGGGGYSGVDSTPVNSSSSSTAGTQAAGGTGNYTGSFGQGANSTAQGAGGGGGYYGGGSGSNNGGGSGGSGYIGNPLLINYEDITKTMYCYNCKGSSGYSTKTVSTTDVSDTSISGYVKSGNGYSTITYIGSEEATNQIDSNYKEIYDYTGTAQTFTAPETGYYKLETWGAQGGYGYSTTYNGGYGGYSTGAVYLEKNQTIYIYVGKNGSSATSMTASAVAGGYNGGGNGFGQTDKYVGAGGGATHIATASGLLSSLSANQSSILIVAAGGGGGAYQSASYYGSGGMGGGYMGNIGTIYGTAQVMGNPGNQSSGGTGFVAGTFGQGGSAGSSGVGGGGGYYGGGASQHYGGGAGGSGYIGNTSLIPYNTYEKKMYCYNCTESVGFSTRTYSTTNFSNVATSNYAKSGNGYSVISYISNEEPADQGYDNYKEIYDCTKTAQTFTAPKTGYYKLEAWGAQGGYASSTSYNGGYGGYSTGTVHLEKDQTIYVYVGEQGTNDTVANAAATAGGYNGGGQGFGAADKYVGGGGGTTHVATTSGLLSTLSSSQSSILIVAAGGGGAAYQSASLNGKNGHGGGYVGVNATVVGTSPSTGGTQIAGGTGYFTGSFGQGASCSSNGCGGGGAGYYGGGAGQYYGGGSGGSGYIGNSSLLTYNGVIKTMYCSGCIESTGYSTKSISTTNVSATATSNYVKSGNGYVTISYSGDDEAPDQIDSNYNEIYDYTGTSQTFAVPKTGYYKLEVWGAQGGGENSTNTGGYGGYSKGTVYLTKDTTLYIYIGGKGSTCVYGTAYAGGYNGGGGCGYWGSSSVTSSNGAGGGATHIATASGLLSTLSSSQSSILIVAGGGGGGSYNSSNATYRGTGGMAGGYIGSQSTNCASTSYCPTGGTQSAGGSGDSIAFAKAGIFGSAGTTTSATTNNQAGGGAGYYGGGQGAGPGGGGSGYIGNTSLVTYGGVTKSMYCYNCAESQVDDTRTISTTNVSATATGNYAKSGNGAAKISFVSTP